MNKVKQSKYQTEQSEINSVEIHFKLNDELIIADIPEQRLKKHVTEWKKQGHIRKTVELDRTLGETIALHRKKKSEPLSQAELAKKLGVKQSMISQIENNKRTPSKEMIKLLQKILKINIKDIRKVI